jgi:hypothetical protein
MDYFSEDEGDFLVMEFIPGYDLAELLDLRGSPFPQSQAMRWADELLRVLEYLHGQKPPILHRDIKPSNLKLTKQGEIFLLDFGLAKGSTGQMPTLATSRSVRGYTPIYASLEQIHGHGTDARSDIYSLGATLYHLLTAMAPIDAPTRFHAVEDEEPDPLQPIEKLNRQASQNVADVIHQAMAVSRKQRPISAGEMRKALRNAAEEDERHSAEEEYRRAEEMHRERGEDRLRAEEEATRRAEEDRLLLQTETSKQEQEAASRAEEQRRLREVERAKLAEENARNDAEKSRRQEAAKRRNAEAEQQRAEQALREKEECRKNEEAERQRRETEEQEVRRHAEETARRKRHVPVRTIPAPTMPALPPPTRAATLESYNEPKSVGQGVKTIPAPPPDRPTKTPEGVFRRTALGRSEPIRIGAAPKRALMIVAATVLLVTVGAIGIWLIRGRNAGTAKTPPVNQTNQTTLTVDPNSQPVQPSAPPTGVSEQNIQSSPRTTPPSRIVDENATINANTGKQTASKPSHPSTSMTKRSQDNGAAERRKRALDALKQP